MTLNVWLSADPVLNLSFLIDYVMEEVKPLNWDAVLASPIPLKVPILPSGSSSRLRSWNTENTRP